MQSTIASTVIAPVAKTEGNSGNQSSGEMPIMALRAIVGNRMTPPCHPKCHGFKQESRQDKVGPASAVPGKMRCCWKKSINCEKRSEIAGEMI
jgi:hypothetical protein